MKRFTLLFWMFLIVQYAISQTATLNVTVRKDNTSGTLQVGVPVTIVNAAQSINQTVSTNASGVAQFTGLPKAAYTLTVTASSAGFTNYSGTQAVTATSTTLSKTVSLLWIYNVDFLISDGTNPITTANVAITSAPTSNQNVDGTGATSFQRNIGACNYTVTAPNFADTSKTATVVTNTGLTIPTIVMKPGYDVTFNVLDNASSPISGASIAFKGFGVTTSYTTDGAGQKIIAKKKNSRYTYIISKTGYADVSGEVIVNGSAMVVPITLNPGADFTFTVKKGGVTALSNDSLTVNGLMKVTNGSGVVVFGLPLGSNNYTNKRYAFVDAAGTINVDGVTPANNALTIALTPIYSIKFGTKDENNVAVAGATIIFNGQTYTTNASGLAYVYNVAPIINADPNKQYYKFTIFKDGYADYVDSLKCTTSTTSPYTASTTNRINIDQNYFAFTKPRIDINYNPSMAYATLYVDGIDHSGDIFYMGGGSIYNVASGTHTYYMKYLGSGNTFTPARGKVVVTSHSSARINVDFATGHKLIINTTDNFGNPVEGAKVFAADTTVNTDVNGAADFKTRYNGIYPYSVIQKNLEGTVIGRGKGSVTMAGADITTEVCVIQPVYSVAIKVLKGWEDPLVGATVTVDGISVVTGADGIALLPCMAGETTYTVTPPTNDYLPSSGSITVVDATTTTDVYLKKACSVSFTITDGTNPITGALISVGSETRVTNVTGQAEFTKTFQGGWAQYTYTVSANGYADSTVTVWLSEDLVVEPIALKKAYDIVFTVKNNLNIPLSNATIIFNNSIFKTNSIGKFTFYKKINGTYTYIVSAAGFADVVGNVIVNDANINQTITFSTGYDVTFTVINGPTGTVGFKNDAITVNGATKYTDENGIVTFGVAPNANISFVHHINGFADATVELLNITANTNYTINLTPVYTVKLRAVDANSFNPIKDASVVFNSETKLTDVDGYATYTAIAPSATDYVYTITGPGTYNSVSGTITLPFTSTEEYLSTENVVSFNKELSSPGVYFALTNGMMSYYGDATITFNGADYTYDTGMGGTVVNCAAGTYNWIVTPGDVTKAIIRGTVTVTTNVEYQSVNMTAARKIEIFAVDKNSNPIEGATVTLDGITVNTDASGDAIYNRMPAGTYNYTVSKDGYIASGTKTLEVNTADIIELVSLQLVEYSITFNVSNGTTGIEGAAVTIGTTTINTDATGKAVFEALVPGIYNYTIVKPGYDNATGSAELTNSNITKDITMVLTPYTLTFNITTGGNALEGASVTIDGTTVTSDASGHAVFTGKTMGIYAYTVTKTGYNDVTGNATVETSNKTVDITMVITTYNITFTVNDGTNAILGANVTIGTSTVVTDASGHAVFNNIPGTYSYSITALGYNTATGSVTVTNANVAQTVTLVLTTFDITFNVSKNSVPVVGANVTIGTTTIVTNASGIAVFTGKIPGTYSYTVTAAGYANASGSVTVVNANVTQNVTLTFPVGIDDNSIASVRAYPNPTTGNLNVSLPQNIDGGATIRIMNIIGNVLYENRVDYSTNELKLDISGYSNGIYFVRIKCSGFEKTIKVVKN